MGLFLLGVLGGGFAMMKWGDRIREAMSRTSRATDVGRHAPVSVEETLDTDR